MSAVESLEEPAGPAHRAAARLLQRDLQRRPARCPVHGPRHRSRRPGRAHADARLAAPGEPLRPDAAGPLPRGDRRHRLRPGPDERPPGDARAPRARGRHRARGRRADPPPRRTRPAAQRLRARCPARAAGTPCSSRTATSASAGPRTRCCAVPASCSGTGGRVVCDLAGPGTGLSVHAARISTRRLRSATFPWAQVGPDAIGPSPPTPGSRVRARRRAPRQMVRGADASEAPADPHGGVVHLARCGTSASPHGSAPGWASRSGSASPPAWSATGTTSTTRRSSRRCGRSGATGSPRACTSSPARRRSRCSW